MDDFAQFDTRQLAYLLRTGKLSTLELVTQAIARIEASEPQLTALTYRNFEHKPWNALKRLYLKMSLETCQGL